MPKKIPFQVAYATGKYNKLYFNKFELIGMHFLVTITDKFLLLSTLKPIMA